MALICGSLQKSDLDVHLAPTPPGDTPPSQMINTGVRQPMIHAQLVIGLVLAIHVDENVIPCIIEQRQ